MSGRDMNPSDTMRAVRVHQHGGPEVRHERLPMPAWIAGGAGKRWRVPR